MIVKEIIVSESRYNTENYAIVNVGVEGIKASKDMRDKLIP